MTPTISVLIPCHNGAAFLRATIDCVLAQRCQPVEVIVVDDGSTDDSAAIAESYGPPVRVVRQTNKGEGGARNAGAAVASGSHLYFLDADDLLERDALERLSGAVRSNPDAVVLMGAVHFNESPEKPILVTTPTATQFFPDMINSCLGVPHAWLTPRALYDRTAGFSLVKGYFVDWEFWCRIALMNPPLVVLPYAGALYRRHAATMSATTPFEKRARGHVAVMETLTSGMLAQPELLRAYGHDLFWCSWIALHRARQAGIAWSELRGLQYAITRLAREGPSSVRNTTFGRLTRWLGLRLASRLRDLTARDTGVMPQRAGGNAVAVAGADPSAAG